MTRRSHTVNHPDGVCHVVSRTLVPGTYLRWLGTMVVEGPNRNEPAARSNKAPNRLGESGRGRHSHSTDPLGATSALASQSDKNA